MSATQKRNIGLWVLQVLLAALFLYAGVMKLIMPVEMMRGPVPLPGAFLRFIGVAEAAGAIGLILPGLFRIKQSLTPLAALCLVCIMTGATVITLESGLTPFALIPLTVGMLLTSVAYGRRQWAPLGW